MAPRSDVAPTAVEELDQDETVTFEATESESGNVWATSSTPEQAPLFDSNVSSTHVHEDIAHASENASFGSNQGADYEIVDANTEDDAELDELEAEIARELEE